MIATASSISTKPSQLASELAVTHLSSQAIGGGNGLEGGGGDTDGGGGRGNGEGGGGDEGG